ncbi:MAG: hypothetical protein M0T86_03180, partial [Betaproteobacteria bacterium]|nr:hypothetical protein [Betaproteobacteria bacterium]
ELNKYSMQLGTFVVQPALSRLATCYRLATMMSRHAVISGAVDPFSCNGDTGGSLVSWSRSASTLRKPHAPIGDAVRGGIRPRRPVLLKTRA